MPCTHPIKAWRHAFKTNGKAINLRAPPPSLVDTPGFEWINLPCGKCIKCLQRKTLEWSLRMELEALDYANVWFLTLTYDDDHLPLSPSGLPTLRYSDVQKFLKRLRTNSGQKFRYFAASEYGDRTQRPHYHLIIYGLDIPDLRPYNVNMKGKYYVSKFIDQTWQGGSALVAPGIQRTFQYVAGYVLKKQFGTKGDNYYLDRERPIARMSRNPGIGSIYVDYNCDSHFDTGEIIGHCDFARHPIPKYFNDRLLKKERYDLWEKLRVKRKESIKEYSEAQLDAIEKTAESRFNLKRKGVL